MESDVSIENNMDNGTYMFSENSHRMLHCVNKLPFRCDQVVTSDHHNMSESLLVTNNYNFADINNTTSEVQQSHNVRDISQSQTGFGNYPPSVNRVNYIGFNEMASRTSHDNISISSNQGDIFCNVGVENDFNKHKLDTDKDKCGELTLMEPKNVYQNNVELGCDKDKAIQCANNDHYKPNVPESLKCADNAFGTKLGDDDEGLSTVIEEHVASSRPKRKQPKVSYIESPTSELAITKCMSEKEHKHKKSKSNKLNANHCRRRIFKTAHFNEMFKGFHEYQKAGKYCDVRLCMDDGSILVHSLVVITACPYFLKQFKSLPKIYSGLEPIKSLTFSDIPYWAMEKVVTFLYSGETDIDDNLVEDFNKHCSMLGINGLEWETISKPLVTVTEASGIKIKLKKIKHDAKKYEKIVCNDTHSQKSKKRKHKTGKSSEKKAKKTKKMITPDKEQDTNVVVKVETSTNTFEVLDKSEKLIHEENNDSCYSTACDADGNSCESDTKSKEKFNDSGDDTDSYFFDHDINETITKEGNDMIDNVLTESIDKQVVDNINGNGGACDKCGREFFFQSELVGHRNRCTGKTNRQRKKCVTCNLNFDNTEKYLSHRNTDKKCLSLRQEKLVIRKQKRLEMRRKFACCVCPRRFRRLADKIEHEFIAHEVKYDKEQWPDLHCEFCNYWSMNPWKLHHHKQFSCSKGQESICDVCGNSYKNELTLKKHKELMHTDVQPMLTCEECGKSLKGKKGLRLHIRLQHRGENLHNIHMCHICSQTYRTANDLTLHLHKAHELPLPEGYVVYRCNKCDYIHNSKKFYEKHMFLHEDKREWICNMCCKAFKTRNSLNTHMIVHTSSRIPCPFDGCTYKALKNCHLKNHIENQHTQKGEKKEKCHLCDYSTFFKGNLIKHQRSVHKLEIVTKHSVEMKAKYKNLKRGQIVGFEQDVQTCNTTPLACNPRELTGGEFNVVSIPQHNLAYPVSSSSGNSVIDNQMQFEKTIAVTPHNIVDPMTYTVNNVPMFTRNGNFTTNMYSIPPLDFSTYNTGSAMHQM